MSVETDKLLSIKLTYQYITQFLCSIARMIYKPNKNVPTTEIAGNEENFICYLYLLFDNSDVQIYT
jgi:hypothetical protein